MVIIGRVILAAALAVLLASARAGQEAEETEPGAEPMATQAEQAGAAQSEEEEAKEEEQANEQQADGQEQASEEGEGEQEADREECDMQLMPFRAEDDSGAPRDSAILVDGCTGESMLLKLGSWKNSETGELEKMYYWVRIPRANPKRYEDNPAPR